MYFILANHKSMHFILTNHQKKKTHSIQTAFNGIKTTKWTFQICFFLMLQGALTFTIKFHIQFSTITFLSL